MRLWRDSAANRKASKIGSLLPKIGRLLPRIRKFFSEESEGFFRTALGSYTHKFPKRCAASLTYLPRSRLDLPCSRLGLPHLRLSRNSGPATEGFSNRGINFKDAYRKPLAMNRMHHWSLLNMHVTFDTMTLRRMYECRSVNARHSWLWVR